MPTGLTQLLEHAEAAADYASDRIYRAHPELLARFGEKGRRMCREDIATHLAFIGGAIAAGSSLPFVEYLRWLQGVLHARGVPDESLSESVRLVGEYFDGRLQEQEMESLRRVLADGIAALAGEGAEEREPAFMKWMPNPLPDAFPLADHLTEGEVHLVHDTVHDLQAAGASYLDIAARLFQPALYRVGDLWQENRISVAQEHLAAAIAQKQLALAYSAADFAMPTGQRALFACVQGNRHALGLRMVADAFDLAGWEAQYLGADLPLAALLSQVGAVRPHVLGLSASLASQVPALKASLAALRGEFGRECPVIMVGGLALNQVDELWKVLGADLWAPSADLALSSLSP